MTRGLHVLLCKQRPTRKGRILLQV